MSANNDCTDNEFTTAWFFVLETHPVCFYFWKTMGRQFLSNLLSFLQMWKIIPTNGKIEKCPQKTIVRIMSLYLLDFFYFWNASGMFLFLKNVGNANFFKSVITYETCCIFFEWLFIQTVRLHPRSNSCVLFVYFNIKSAIGSQHHGT